MTVGLTRFGLFSKILEQFFSSRPLDAPSKRSLSVEKYDQDKTMKIFVYQKNRVLPDKTEWKTSCNLCGSNFNYLEDLHFHSKVVHSNINKSDTKKNEWMFNCNECKTKFQHYHKLKSHVRAIHLNINHFICQACGSFFALKEQLARHVKDKAKVYFT